MTLLGTADVSFVNGFDLLKLEHGPLFTVARVEVNATVDVKIEIGLTRVLHTRIGAIGDAILLPSLDDTSLENLVTAGANNDDDEKQASQWHTMKLSTLLSSSRSHTRCVRRLMYRSGSSTV